MMMVGGEGVTTQVTKGLLPPTPTRLLPGLPSPHFLLAVASPVNVWVGGSCERTRVVAAKHDISEGELFSEDDARVPSFLTPSLPPSCILIEQCTNQAQPRPLTSSRTIYTHNSNRLLRESCLFVPCLRLLAASSPFWLAVPSY